MKQALHIFRKDVIYLRYEIGITLLAAMAFTLAATRNISALGTFLPVTWWFLIARVIHAEALPGYRQFWITRPYRWKSLLYAKFLFVFVFVNLPLLIADTAIIHAAGFSIGHQLAALLWNQVLLTMAFVLPVAALSAITSGLGDFLLATLLVAIGVMAWVATGFWIRWDSPWFELEWIRTYCLIAQLASAAVVILLWQYARRDTSATRTVAVAIAVAFWASSSLLPWTKAFALQTHLSQRGIAPASIRIELDSDRKWLGHIYAAERDQIVAELPLQISGIPAGMEFRPNGLKVALRAPDGETSVTNQPPPSSLDFEAGITSLRATMGRAFYAKVKNQPLELRGTLFFTLYGNKQSTPIPIDGASVPVKDVGLCSAGGRFLRCSSVFRIPSGLVAIQALQDSPMGPKGTTERPFVRTSYSPFPADLRIDPLDQWFFSPQTEMISAAHVETLEPLAYLEQNFEIDHVRLSDYTASSLGVAK